MAKFEELAVRYVTDLIRDFDLLTFQAAGIVANGGHESGGFEHLQELNPTSGRGGLGHFQWTASRRVAFEQWLARNADKGWTAGTYEANYSMLFRELMEGGPENAALVAVKATRTLDEATRVFCEKFERPGVVHMETRLQYAKRALAAFEASGIDPIKLMGEDRPGSSSHTPGQEVLPPLPKIDLNSLAPIILGVLTMLQKSQQQGGTQGGQQPDIMALLLPFLQQLSGAQPLPLPPPVAVQPPPEPVVVTKSEAKPSVGLGLLGLFGSAIGMATGAVGTPFGMGADPTTAGTLSILIPAAISAVGATGIFGPFGAVAARIASAAFSAAVKAPKS